MEKQTFLKPQKSISFFFENSTNKNLAFSSPNFPSEKVDFCLFASDTFLPSPSSQGMTYMAANKGKMLFVTFSPH